MQYLLSSDQIKLSNFVSIGTLPQSYRVTFCNAEWKKEIIFLRYLLSRNLHGITANYEIGKNVHRQEMHQSLENGDGPETRLRISVRVSVPQFSSDTSVFRISKPELTEMSHGIKSQKAMCPISN